MAYKRKSNIERKPSPASDGRSVATPTSRKPSAIVLGHELEYRVARLHIFMGYFVRRGCPIYTVGALDQATDLDVLALRYAEPFRRESTVTECKSGDVGPLDRIFWLSGVKRYTGAQQAFLIRKGTKWNIKDFAKECGVQILDLGKLSELEAAYKIGEADWPGISDRDFYSRELSTWNKILGSEAKLWELFLTISSEVRYDEPFVGINYLLQQLRLLTRAWPRIPFDSFHRFILSESISQVAIFLMQVAGQCFDLNKSDQEGFIRKGLTYGSLEPRYADRILNSAYNLTRQAIVHYTNRDLEIDRSLFEMPTPPGTNEVISVVAEILRKYPTSLNFPQVCDLTLTEVFTKENKAKGWLRRIFPQPDLAARVDTVQFFLKALVTIGACPSYVLESLNLPTLENGPPTGAPPRPPVLFVRDSEKTEQAILELDRNSVSEKK